MGRFVRDGTFPDGTQVIAGTRFTKTFVIRNDGSSEWPAGVMLIPNGGDPMFTMEPIQTIDGSYVAIIDRSVAPNEEVEVSVQLTAPDRTGRHVSYFRLKAPNGGCFGQRLWVDVLIITEDPDISGSGTWDVIGADSDAFVDSNESTSKAVDNASATTATNVQETLCGGAVSATVTVEACGGSAVITDSSALVVPTPVPVSAMGSGGGASGATAPDPMEVWGRVWAKELQILADMGFSDPSVLVPLLQQHVGLPVSLCPELQGHPPADGMQKVVAELLGASGRLA
jgi:hypothetical protein